MISAVAFCPQAPVLVPDVAQGAAGELDDLRAACRTAIGRLVAPGRQIVVLGSGRREAVYGPTTRGSFAGFGLDLEVPLGSDEPGPADLPPSLTVGAWLLRDALGPNSGAVGYSVTDGFSGDNHWDERYGDDIGVLVMGDGSARRSVKAPGYLDERAAGVDDYLASALRDGAGDRLHQSLVDPDDELLVGGRDVWELVSWSVEAAEWDAELLYAAAPFGVGYLVASWSLDISGVRDASAVGTDGTATIHG